MKKIIIRIGIVLAILVCVYVVARPKIHEITRKSDIKNFLNEKGTANISKETKKRYKYSNEKVEEYDISQLMGNYVNTIYEVVKSRYIAKDYYPEYNFVVNNSDGSLIQNGFDGMDCEVLNREMTPEAFREYRDGVFLDNFARKIEEAIQGKIEHRSDWIMGDYYIKADQEFEIELPFNVIMTYIPRKLEKLEKKEVTNVELKRTGAGRELEATVDYIDGAGASQKTTMYVNFNDTGWHNDDMTINIYGWFYNIKDPDISISCKNKADVIVSNHSEDNDNGYNGDEYEMDKNGRNGIWFMNDEGEYELKYVDENGNIIEDETKTEENETENETEELVEETEETKKKSLKERLKEME